MQDGIDGKHWNRDGEPWLCLEQDLALSSGELAHIQSLQFLLPASACSPCGAGETNNARIVSFCSSPPEALSPPLLFFSVYGMSKPLHKVIQPKLI